MPDVFVFGSNLAGRHGKGAALTAVQQWGAVHGKGFGHHGNSYAIPTKDEQLQVLPLHRIEGYVKAFLQYARMKPELRFLVTAIGTGLAGYGHHQIAPMFVDAPDNCELPKEWRPIIDMLVRQRVFDEATEHPYECDCGKCQLWWEIMGPEDDGIEGLDNEGEPGDGPAF